METFSKIIFAVFIVGAIYLISNINQNHHQGYIKPVNDSLQVDSVEHKTYKNYRVYPTRNHSRYLLKRK